MDASVTVCEGGIWDGYFVHLLLFIVCFMCLCLLCYVVVLTNNTTADFNKSSI